MARPPAFIDHIIIQVADLPRSLEFYRAALKPLGAEVTDVPGPPESWGPAVVLGPPDAEDLALVEGGRPAHSTSPLSLRTPRRCESSTLLPWPAGACQRAPRRARAL